MKDQMDLALRHIFDSIIEEALCRPVGMSYTLYETPDAPPDTPDGRMRVIARGGYWRDPVAVAIADTHDVEAAANDLRGLVRRRHGYTPVFEVRDWRGNDLTALYGRDVR